MPLIVGGAILGVPGILGPSMEHRFHAHTAEQCGNAYARYRTEVPALIPFIAHIVNEFPVPESPRGR